MNKLISLGFCVLLLATAANSQVPGGNLYVGYSYFNFNPTFSPDNHRNFNGWDGALEVKMLPFISGVADISGNYGTVREFIVCSASPIPGGCLSASPNTSVHTFLFGPRISASVSKFRPFGEVLIGAGHASIERASTVPAHSDTSFSTAVGGGLDYKLITAVAWRFEGDYVQTRFFNTKQDNFRLTTGLVLRF
jgi:opacity protein-like surface antigen